MEEEWVIATRDCWSELDYSKMFAKRHPQYCKDCQYSQHWYCSVLPVAREFDQPIDPEAECGKQWDEMIDCHESEGDCVIGLQPPSNSDGVVGLYVELAFLLGNAAQSV